MKKFNYIVRMMLVLVVTFMTFSGAALTAQAAGPRDYPQRWEQHDDRDYRHDDRNWEKERKDWEKNHKTSTQKLQTANLKLKKGLSHMRQPLFSTNDERPTTLTANP